jgi:hypothetical protein
MYALHGISFMMCILYIYSSLELLELFALLLFINRTNANSILHSFFSVHLLFLSAIGIISVGAISTYTILYAVELDPNFRKFVIAVAFALCIVGTVDAMYRPMMVDLLLGKDMSKTFKVEKGAHRTIFDIYNGNPKIVIDSAPTGSRGGGGGTSTSNNSSRSVTSNINFNDLQAVALKKKEINDQISQLQSDLALIMEREMFGSNSQNSGANVSKNSVTAD